MSNRESDPLAYKAHADLIVERAAEQLRHLLHEAVQKLDPFPPFPGAFFTYGIEVEPGALASPERGCVVLGPDGELYELEVEIDFSQDASDPVAAREERLKKLDLHPCDYVVYAYHALSRVVELLLEQAEARDA
jgi:hypothetical protein